MDQTIYYPIAAEENYHIRREFHAVWTGEIRPPRKGEWFLSGAIVEAYKAHSDLNQSLHIAQLMRKTRA
jgi:hypothetical protein